MAKDIVRVLLPVMIAGCQPVASEPIALPDPPLPEPPVAVVPTSPPKAEVTVRNLGPHECMVALWAGEGMPTRKLPATTLPLGTTTFAMAKGEHLALRNPEGGYGAMGGTEGDRGEIVVHHGCRAIAVSAGFAPDRLATMAPHVIAACCDACDERGCTGCAESNSGATCKAEQGKCARFDDAFDCVPAAVVDGDGTVGGEYAFRRLTPPRDAAK